MKSPATAIIAIIAAVMFVGVVVYNLTFPGSASVLTQSGPVSGPALLARTAGTPTSLDARIAEMRRSLNAAYTSRKAGEAMITLSEADMNEAAARIVLNSGPHLPMQIKSVSVDLQGGSVVQTTLNAVSLGMAYSIQVRCSIQIKDGALDNQVLSVEAPFLLSQFKGSVGSMVRDKSTDLLNTLARAGDGYAGKLDIGYTSVEVTDDSLTIKVWAAPVQDQSTTARGS